MSLIRYTSNITIRLVTIIARCLRNTRFKPRLYIETYKAYPFCVRQLISCSEKVFYLQAFCKIETVQRTTETKSVWARDWSIFECICNESQLKLKHYRVSAPVKNDIVTIPYCYLLLVNKNKWPSVMWVWKYQALQKNKINKSASGSYKIFFSAIVATSIALSTKNVL